MNLTSHDICFITLVVGAFILAVNFSIKAYKELLTKPITKPINEQKRPQTNKEGG